MDKLKLWQKGGEELKDTGQLHLPSPLIIHSIGTSGGGASGNEAGE